MGKKYIEVNGKKYFAEEKDGEPEKPVEGAPEVAPEAVPETPADEPAADVAEQAKQIGKIIAKEVVAGLDMSGKVENDKVAKILKGKDLTDKDALTVNEKIVGFYHALVNKDIAVLKALSEGWRKAVALVKSGELMETPSWTIMSQAAC